MTDLSYFLDGISLNDNLQQGSQDPLYPIPTTPLSNMYHLLLSQQEKSNMTRLIPPITPPSPPPVYTINPRELRSSASDSSTVTLPTDFSSSPSSVYGQEDQGHSNPSQFEKPQKQSRMSWTISDELQEVIRKWLEENERLQLQQRKELEVQQQQQRESEVQQPTLLQRQTHLKRNSISDMGPASTIRVPLNKRRKSESSLAFRPAFSAPSTVSSRSAPPSKSATPQLNNTQDFEEDWDEEEEEKPFKCDGCPKAFRRQEHLKRHFRSVHSNIRPFPCRFCEKKFSRSDNLAQHLRTHRRD